MIEALDIMLQRSENIRRGDGTLVSAGSYMGHLLRFCFACKLAQHIQAMIIQLIVAFCRRGLVCKKRIDESI